MRVQTNLVFVLSITCLLGSRARAADLHVPSQYSTIQAAIDAAATNDHVVVADGTYTGLGNKNVSFNKNITVRSASNDPSACIINCQFSARGFIIASGAAGGTLKGFTIKNANGFAGPGGGIKCEGAVTIENCWLLDNTAPDIDAEGAGLYINSSSGTVNVKNCQINGNSSDRSAGVHIGSASTLRDCVISENLALVRGGGGAVYQTNASLVNCTISNNVVGPGFNSSDGGGLAVEVIAELQIVKLVNCTITANDVFYTEPHADIGRGAGILHGGGELQLTNCLISENGQGFQIGGSIDGVADHGGGIANIAGTIKTVNCTIVNNTATVNGGGYYHHTGAEDQSVFTNCIFRLNDATSGDNIAMINADAETLEIRYCNLQGGEEEILNGPVGVYEATFDEDPLFVGGGDYQLQYLSPCLNNGNASALPADEFDLDGDSNTGENVPFDVAGGSRQANPTSCVDIGAFENQVQGTCAGDITGGTNGVPDGSVNVVDLLLVINQWGLAGGAADMGSGTCGDGSVNVSDLLIVINGWGECEGGGGDFPESLSDCWNEYCNGLSGEDYTACLERCTEAYCSQTPTPSDCP